MIAPGGMPNDLLTESEILVIGAGPGGLSAALRLKRLNLPVRVLESRLVVGGQLNSIYGPIPDYLGLPVQSGAELVPHFVRHLNEARIPLELGTEVRGIEPARQPGALHHIHLADGQLRRTPLLILAPGTRTRTLDVPGETELLGRGVSRSCSRDKEQVVGADVVVVGGGDAALEGALILAERARRVTVLHRGPAFRARPDFLARARALSHVTLQTSTRVVGIEGRDWVERLVLERSTQDHSAQLERIAASFIFVRIGVAPCTHFLRGILTLDAEGYGEVDHNQETSVSGIYMVGDACSPGFSSIANATGQGMIAAKSAERAWRR